ncbi:unnamed protein product [Calypogeia fissa]
MSSSPERIFAKRYRPAQLWARMAQYASDKEIDWAAPGGVPPNLISEDEEDDQADEERSIRQETREQMASAEEKAPHVNKALFGDGVEDDDDILSRDYVFSSQGPSQTRVDEEPVAEATAPGRVILDPNRVPADAEAAAQAIAVILRDRLQRR